MRWRLEGLFLPKINNLPYYVKGITIYLHATMSRLPQMDAPVVVTVHEAVAGDKLTIAIACDVYIAAETKRFRAWHDIYRNLTLLRSGGNVPWMEQAGITRTSCTDGLRPVIFKLGRIK
jgi:uncharacterized repeat protein (TIGR04076 family)